MERRYRVCQTEMRLVQRSRWKGVHQVVEERKKPTKNLMERFPVHHSVQSVAKIALYRI